MDNFLTDSTSLMRAFQAIEGSGAFKNSTTGLGTSRDKNQHNRVNIERRMLTPMEILELSTDELVATVIESFPQDAEETWCRLGGTEDTGAEMLSYLDQIGTTPETDIERELGGIFGVRDSFAYASILARQFGEAYIIMGIDDGGTLEDPVDESRIDSIRWMSVADCYELYPHWSNDLDTRRVEPDFFQMAVIGGNIKIHKSRLLRFWGKKRIGTRRWLGNKTGRSSTGFFEGASVVQGMYDAYRDWVVGVSASSAMLNDYDVFTLGIKGLGNTLLRDKQTNTTKGQEQMVNRAIALDMGKSITRGLLYDLENEEPGTVTRTYTGADKIMENLERRFIASTEMPRFKLMGERDTGGLNDNGLAMRYEWAMLVQRWAVNNWNAPLSKLVRYANAASDAPSIGQNWSLTFPFGLKLNDSERLEYEKLAAERAEILVGMGALAPSEVRQCYENGQFDDALTIEGDLDTVDDDEIVTEEEEFNADATWGVWFEGRNTPAVVSAESRSEAISKAKRKGSAGSKGKVKAARQLKGSSLRQARKGKWVRERANGATKPQASDPYKYRPQLKNKAKPNTDEDDLDTPLEDWEWDELANVSAADWIDTATAIADGGNEA